MEASATRPWPRSARKSCGGHGSLAVKDLGLQSPDPSVNARQPLAELENRVITVQVDSPC